MSDEPITTAFKIKTAHDFWAEVKKIANQEAKAVRLPVVLLSTDPDTGEAKFFFNPVYATHEDRVKVLRLACEAFIKDCGHQSGKGNTIEDN